MSFRCGHHSTLRRGCDGRYVRQYAAAYAAIEEAREAGEEQELSLLDFALMSETKNNETNATTAATPVT